MESAADDKYAFALTSNESWASYKAHQNPSYFPTLSTGQSPQILWLGCSDSRVPETTLLGLQPGDVFVHRNIANIINGSDINSAAVIEYAVVHLKVKHVVLSGHSFCGGAAAALGTSMVGGVLDTWLAPLRAVVKKHREELEGIENEKARAIRLAELNVMTGVQVLLANHNIEEAVRERGLEVHGVVYDIASGKLRDLRCGNGKGDGMQGVGHIKDGVLKDVSASAQA